MIKKDRVLNLGCFEHNDLQVRWELDEENLMCEQ